MTNPFTAGQKLHASDLNIFTAAAACNSNLTATTTTVTDIAGATVTFTTTHTNVVVSVVGVFDIVVNSTSSAAALGALSVDGSAQSAQSLFVLSTSGARVTCAQNWNVTLAASGSHT